jgi:hypothetical protein
MNRNVIEMFASSYPKNKLGGTSVQDFDGALFDPPVPLQSHHYAGNPQRSKPQQRTPIQDVVEGYKSSSMSQASNVKVSSITNGMRKFLAILLIVFLGAFLFSSFSYTISDTIFSKFGLQFFAEGGNPGMVIIVIHSLIFLALVYLITSVFSWC